MGRGQEGTNVILDNIAGCKCSTLPVGSLLELLNHNRTSSLVLDEVEKGHSG